MRLQSNVSAAAAVQCIKLLDASRRRNARVGRRRRAAKCRRLCGSGFGRSLAPPLITIFKYDIAGPSSSTSVNGTSSSQWTLECCPMITKCGFGWWEFHEKTLIISQIKEFVFYKLIEVHQNAFICQVDTR